MRYYLQYIAAVWTLGLVFTLAGLTLATAQSSSSSTSQSGSQSQAAAQAGAVSQSGSTLIFNNPGNTKSEAEITNVPSVTAPSLGGGGHPCLAAVSGGISVLGGGASLGKSDAEVVCMLAFMGQHEAAIRALVSKDRAACRAIENVGYYIVPLGNGKTKAVRFRCADKTVKGGIYSASAEGIGTKPVAAPTTSTRAKAKVPYSKCGKRADGAVVFRKAQGFTSEVAKAACLTALGY